MNKWLSTLPLAAVTLAGCSSPSETEASRAYRFEVLEPRVSAGRDAGVRVRLVRVADGQPVRGAVFTAHRFEMWMSGFKVATSVMVEGRTPVAVMATEEANGVYLIHAVVPMAGNWEATLTAQVPGADAPVQGAIRFVAA